MRTPPTTLGAWCSSILLSRVPEWAAAFCTASCAGFKGAFSAWNMFCEVAVGAEAATCRAAAPWVWLPARLQNAQHAQSFYKLHFL